MNDLEREIRETLRHHEGDAPTFDSSDARHAAARTRRRQIVNVAGVGLGTLVIVIGLVVGLGGLVRADRSPIVLDTPSPSQTSTPPPSIPMEDGPRLEPGTYSVSSEGRTGSDPLLWSIVDYTITIPEGWKGHTGHYLSKYEGFDEARGLVIYPVLVDEVYADPCEGERGPIEAAGPKVNDLVDALLEQPGTATTEPVQTTIGGLPATRIDLEVPKGADLRSCFLADFGRPGLQVWFSKPTQTYFVLMPGYTASIYVVDVDGERQVFLTQHGPAASNEDLRELQSMLDSIHID